MTKPGKSWIPHLSIGRPVAESAKAMARRSAANNEQRRATIDGDLAMSRDEFVATMVARYGEWMGTFLTRYLDSDSVDRDGYGLTDMEVLRLRTTDVPRRRVQDEEAS